MATVYGTNGSNSLNYWNNSGITHGNDLIYALDGDDFVRAGGGDDTIKGGGGADFIDGGSGTDLTSYADSNAAVTVNLSTGRGSGGTAEGDTYVSVENVLGSQYSDVITGNDGANLLMGGGGQDTLKGGGGADTLSGDQGNDQLKGGGGADTLNGGEGIDEANYSSSGSGVIVNLLTDRAYGGDAEGDNLNSIENLSGSAHRDFLYGDNGANVIRGLDGDDALWGEGGQDTLMGGQGNDWLDGGTGVDILIGGLGGDNYRVDNAFDTVTELANQGIDTVHTSLGSYTLGANVENLSFDNVAGAGVRGYGNSLSNTMTGNNQSNLLDGGAGADILTGGGGVDNFVFRAGQANGDRITDFTGNGAASGDTMIFVGYGTIAQGATFRQQTATTWEIASADGTIHDIITLNGPVDFSDFAFVLA